MRYIFLFSTYMTLWVVAAGGQAPPTFEDLLKQNGIGTSHDQLVVALSSPKPQVRGLAAAELAEHHDMQAITPIIAALDVESNPLERLNMAEALLTLRAPQGRRALIKLCTDTRLPDDLRLMSANDLLPEESLACSSAIVVLLASSANPSEQQSALIFLLTLKKFSSPSSQVMAALAVGVRRALVSEIPDVRRKAAECIMIYRIAADKRDLTTALSIETDPESKKILSKAIDSF